MDVARRFQPGKDPEIWDEATLYKDELLGLLLDPENVQGVYRHVYFSQHMTNVVFKLEVHGKMFCNVQEWKTWIEVQDTKWSGYFAPCIDISGNGNVLIMARTEPLKEFPKDLLLPDFFSDVKVENFGRLKGRIVCHDYGGSKIFEKGLKNVKLKPATAL